MGSGVSVGGPSAEEVEEGSTDGVEDGSTEVVERLGLPLERVTLPPSNSASLRERPECPLPTTKRGHEIPA